MDLTKRIIHIMVIEDDDLDQMEITRTLKKRGILHRLTIVGSGEEAIRVLEACADPGALPDIILLDLQLPKMSGMELYSYIRAREEWRGIKIFVLTAAVLNNDAVFDEPGISGVIVKPLRLENPPSIAAFNLMIDMMTV